MGHSRDQYEHDDHERHHRHRDRNRDRNFTGHRPRSEEPAPIASEKVTFDGKVFFLDLKENQRGRMLAVREKHGERSSRITIPAGALKEIHEALARLADYESKLEQP